MYPCESVLHAERFTLFESGTKVIKNTELKYENAALNKLVAVDVHRGRVLLNVGVASLQFYTLRPITFIYVKL